MFRLGNLDSSCPVWLANVLRMIEKSQNDPVKATIYETLYSEPEKLKDGMTVLADGTVWNPGAGQGVYTYYGSAWHKLG